MHNDIKEGEVIDANIYSIQKKTKRVKLLRNQDE